MKIYHPNIVRLVGYCTHSEYNRKYHDRYRILCSEFLQRGSLDEYLKGKMQYNVRILVCGFLEKNSCVCLRDTDLHFKFD
jgi:hypothetical protein